MSYGPTLLVGHDATGLCWLVYNLHRPVHLSPQVRLWLLMAPRPRQFHRYFAAHMLDDCFLRGLGPTTSAATHARSTENPGLPTEARGGDCGDGGNRRRGRSLIRTIRRESPVLATCCRFDHDSIRPIYPTKPVRYAVRVPILYPSAKGGHDGQAILRDHR